MNQLTPNRLHIANYLIVIDQWWSLVTLLFCLCCVLMSFDNMQSFDYYYYYLHQ